MVDFANAKTGLSGIYSTYKRNNLKLVDVKNKLQEQNGYQINKQVLKTNYFPISGRGAGSYQADLMFLPAYKGVGICLCCINVNTRYAYVEPLRNKTKVRDALESIIKKAGEDDRPIIYLQTDRGSEFNNVKVKELLSDYDITYNYVNVADHAGQGKIERFNQTLRRLINLYISSNNNNDWVSVLPDLVYNNRYHRMLESSPAEANEQTEIVKQMKQYEQAKQDFLKYHIGDEVRIIKEKNVFDKGRQDWGTDVFKIEGIKGNLIQVNDRLYKHYELQLVKGSSVKDDFKKELDKQKKEKKIIRTLHAEGIIDDGDSVIFKKKIIKEKIAFDESLIGRKIKRTIGKDKTIYEGTITEIDKEGPYYYLVQYDDLPRGRDSKIEYMNNTEIKKYLVKVDDVKPSRSSQRLKK